MNRLKLIRRCLIAAAMAWTFSGQAQAALTQSLEIHVSINATKSLQALSTSYTYGALSLNASSTTATYITIRNDSGAFIETYTLQGGNAVAQVGGESNWTLAGSTAANTYVFQALFTGTASPGNTPSASIWDATDSLTSGADVCSTTAFGDGSAGDEGASVSPLSAGNAYDRYLWFRVITPDVSAGTGRRDIPVTVAVQ